MPTHERPYSVQPYGSVSDRWNVTGPYIAGGWDGTVPKSHDGMKRDDADWLADLLNRAFAAGGDEARRRIRIEMGVTDGRVGETR